ncbi:preprotein translocase subunit SecE [Microvenator marinus]|jgi:preprotein translocase subunit SecE|uniref:Protein translocase subunit SecE n=1 Tax=Microvenator marinus TaxID=2600177 RepID=A0A5B8Y0P3_9DELT|nr:preprotein translocase subunit SecE [Microvenator marinus]QED29229.1 preprotein translocase subunit SecE [Microvenator marinus]
MEVSRYVNLFYATCLVLAVITFNKLVAQIWESVEVLKDVSIVGNTITLTTLIGVGLGVALTVWAYRREDYRAHVSEVVIELHKVTWPTMDETKRSTMVVIVFTIIVSLYLAGIDRVFSYLTDLLLLHG